MVLLLYTKSPSLISWIDLEFNHTAFVLDFSILLKSVSLKKLSVIKYLVNKESFSVLIKFVKVQPTLSVNVYVYFVSALRFFLWYEDVVESCQVILNYVDSD